MLRKLLEILTINYALVLLLHAQTPVILEKAPEKVVQKKMDAMQTILAMHKANQLPVIEGQLAFSSKLAEVTTKPETKLVKVEYAFVNNTDQTISIKNYDAPCTCFNARLRRADGKESLDFAPGDAGVVMGFLDFENFKGTIDKKILISTENDPPKNPSIELTARVTIPTLIAPDKPAVKWYVGDPVSAKVVMIKVDHDQPIKIVKQSMGFGAGEHFNCHFETIKEGWEYKVTVTPKSTDSPMLGAVRFYTDSPMQRYKMVQVFINVSKRRETKVESKIETAP